jgi:hopanoid biosynthesis associated protein HpnK
VSAAPPRPPASRALIVTADDFGLSTEVNDAVEAAHRRGILSAASLMVAEPAAADAVARARRLPSLRVGLHLSLVEGRPMLPPERVPDLVDAGGRFRTDMARAGAAMFFRPAVRRQLAAEIEAQFAAFAATGLPLDHANAHKHFHLHPTIGALLVATGRRHGLKAVRVPLEPLAVLRAVEPGAAAPGSWITTPWARLLARRLRRQGLTVPDQVFGLAWSGAMTAARLEGVLRRLPPGVTEIYLHPATDGGFDGAAPGYRYAEELAALLAPAALEAAVLSGARRGGFADLAGDRP